MQILDRLLLPRETWELTRLNKIHEAYNNKFITPEQTRHLIYSFKWKYHHDKIDFLILFTNLLK